MNIIVQLVRKGWESTSQNGVTVHVRGQAHLGDEYLDTQALAARFLAVALQDSNPQNLQSSNLPNLVSSLNGNWAAVVHTSSSAFLAVDHIRSIQLLYSQEGENFYVFDDVNDFRKGRKLEIDEDCAHEYLSSGYVYRNRTLFKDVYSLQAAEYVIVAPVQTSKLLNLKTSSTRYWRYIPNINKPVKTGPELVKKIDDAFLAAMRRLVESVGDKRIVVPLSGGYDSRLIVNYLYKLGVKNVLCYTYGSKGNGESLCSKDVASKLGYEWHCVEYSSESKREWMTDSELDDCYRYMCNGTNRPCFQEYFAVKMLRDRGTIAPEKDVIVPGYYFDFLAGSHVAPWILNITAASGMCEWENNFFPKSHFLKSIKSIRNVFNDHVDLSARLFYEGWAWQERLAKFIINAVRAYELLGFDWRLPVCDRGLFDLWLTLPYSLRVERKYFFSVFPQLAVPEISNCPVHGQAPQSVFRRVRHEIGVRVPYVVKYWISNAVGSCPESFIPVPESERKLVEGRIPSARSRFDDGQKVSPNAALSLKSLALMCGEGER